MSLLRKFLRYTNLQSEMVDYDVIHENIERDIIFKGTNLWILVFAIFIASIGLNMNSTAVIIGAMLISPLMGPINGMGYSIATYNFPLFRKALKNFAFAVLASLSASTLYFLMSPLSTAHSELLARTSPTIYDVLIALFGGLAGIVAISSRQKGNVIPGVAIATALMPPLCTAGFGLANANPTFFLGALYLFTINTVFIGISSILISRFLKFPITNLVADGQKKNVVRWISIIIAATVIPSIYFGYALVKAERFTEKATKLIADVSVFKGSYLLNSQIDARNNNVTLIYGGNVLEKADKQEIVKRAIAFELQEAKLIFRQGFSLNDGKENVNQIDKLKTEINRLSLQLQQEQKWVDSIQSRPKIGGKLLAEIKTIFPEIKSCSYSESITFLDSAKTAPIKIVIMETDKRRISAESRSRIQKWLEKRLESENVKTFFN
ncbi:DUF389 domain-containing protein [Flavobacterium sp. NST-5]|uniref:DUF389 domain-containing protein n=1 Tax=Flavobacterium ichthyis TaxID=2698827 RepID=A0ABW9ZDS1_9FLAO|nr:DUF389 domain-containing protein [Flavobacterium ichthyis]NBL65884.1 DUF389 domain-containing protein [Flavobacterium ichthyis]